MALQLRWNEWEGTGERRAALVAGRLEGAGSTADDLIIGAAQDVPAKMVLALDESVGADGILTGQDISEPSQLRGKSIAVQPGFVNHFFLLYVLDSHGLSSKDVKIVPMEPDKASAAFLSRDVDVAVTWEPHLSEVKNHRQDGRVLLTTKDYPDIIVDILVFRNDFINTHSHQVRAFVEAWYDALDFLRENPDESHAIIAAALGLKKEEIGGMLKGVKFLGREDNLRYYDKTAKVNVYSIASTASRLWHQEGYIEHDVDPNELITASFLAGTSK